MAAEVAHDLKGGSRRATVLRKRNKFLNGSSFQLSLQEGQLVRLGSPKKYSVSKAFHRCGFGVVPKASEQFKFQVIFPSVTLSCR